MEYTNRKSGTMPLKVGDRSRLHPFGGYFGHSVQRLSDEGVAEAWVEIEVKLYAKYSDGTIPRVTSDFTVTIEKVYDHYLSREEPVVGIKTYKGITDTVGKCIIRINLTENIPYWTVRPYSTTILVSPDTLGEDQRIVVSSNDFQKINDRLAISQRPAAISLKYAYSSVKSFPEKQPKTKVLQSQRLPLYRFGTVIIDDRGLETSIRSTFPLYDILTVSDLNFPGYYHAGVIRNEEVSSKKAGGVNYLPTQYLHIWSFEKVKGKTIEVSSGGSDQTVHPIESASEVWHFDNGLSRYFIGITGRNFIIYSDSPMVEHVRYEQSAEHWIQIQQKTDAEGMESHGRLFIEYQPKMGLSKSSITTQGTHFMLQAPDAIYNWEIFFHLPILIASQLNKQHKFSEARNWFHYIFDPTTSEPASAGAEQVRFWKFLPFRHQEQPDSILTILEMLANPQTSETLRENLQGQIDAWLDDPFNPFAVARLRPAAFEWFTVIAYVNNLIDWGDQLFRRDTRESINEATLLYVLAAKILGRKPERITRVKNRDYPIHSYRSLEGKWDGFSNAWLSLADSPFLKAMEAWYQWLAQYGANPQDAWNKLEQLYQLASIGSLYFCVPANEKLSELWSKVEERLFNIRHCKNIDGVQRALPLYEPPVDPEVLIRLKAAGLDLEDVRQDQFNLMPHYRFQVLLQKAHEFCNEVKGLGAALLSALEKKEAEHLALIRSKQEIDMLRLVESIKKAQIEEADANLKALEKTRSNTLDRFTFLQRQLGKNEVQYDPEGAPIVEQGMITSVQQSGLPNDFRGLALIQSEIDQIGRLQDGHWSTIIAAGSKTAAGVLKTAAGGAKADLTGTTKEVLSFLGEAASFLGDASSLFASNASFWERRAGLIAGWQRRRDEWVQQSKMAAEEIRQIDKQIIALEIRKKIAEKDLDNHRKQIEFAQNIDEYMRRLKFTGESLYLWMESQLANLYFGAYQMAFELAKRAERAFQFEAGDDSKKFITYGHWDKLRAGLLSGERLSQELRRLELAYLDQNRREHELTKHISLRQLNPVALLLFRATGACEFELPEWLFDLDCPGHYMRRIKSVSLSIPCVAGPYTGVNCTVSLLKSSIRISPNDPNNYGKQGDDTRFKDYYGAIQSIVTSNAQQDSGLFELNFHDERFLPFEGAGAISTWRLELPSDLRQFNYDTISDVIFHVRYTARPGGDNLKSKAVSAFQDLVKTVENSKTELVALLSLKHDFPNEWNKARASATKIFEARIRKEHFPYFAQPAEIAVTKAICNSIKDKTVGPFNPEPIDFKKLSEKINNGQEEGGKFSVNLTNHEEQEVFLVLNYTLLYKTGSST